VNGCRALFQEGNKTPSSREENRGGWGGEKGPSRVDSPPLGPFSPPAGREGVMSCKTLGGRRARAGEEGGFLAPVSPPKDPCGGALRHGRARGGRRRPLSPPPRSTSGVFEPPEVDARVPHPGVFGPNGGARGPSSTRTRVFWGGPSPPLGSRGRTCLPTRAVLATINPVETPEVTPVAP
jgi:hypothetical protein